MLNSEVDCDMSRHKIMLVLKLRIMSLVQYPTIQHTTKNRPCGPLAPTACPTAPLGLPTGDEPVSLSRNVNTGDSGPLTAGKSGERSPLQTPKKLNLRSILKSLNILRYQIAR